MAKEEVKKNIWYLEGPNYIYEEDVKQLARENSLKIIDARVTKDRTGEAAKVPKVTIKDEYKKPDKKK